MARVSDDVLTAHLEGEAVILHLETRNYYRLNGTAARIWKGLEAGGERAAILDELTEEYDTDRATVEAGLDRLMVDLVSAGLLLEGD